MSYRKVDKGKYIIEMEKTIDGQRRRKKKTVYTELKGKDLKFFLTKEENKLAKILEDDTKFKFDSCTFEEWCDYFISTSKATERTKDGYRQYMRLRTMDFFGDMKVKDIKTYHIEKFFTQLENEISKRTLKPLSKKTLSHYHGLLSSLFKRAEKLKIISENPMLEVDGIKVPQKLKGEFYEKEEVQNVMKIYPKLE